MHYETLNRWLRLTLCVALVGSSVPATWAQEAAPAVDATLTNLLKQDPAALVGKINEMKAAAAQHDQEAAELRQKAESLTKQATDIEQRLERLMGHVKALGEKFNMAPAPAAMAPAPADGEMKMAAAPAESMEQPMTNFADHVMPIFQARCLRCHSADKAKGGLNLSLHASALEGGSSGKVIVPGDPGGSRILALILQTEEPVMPPSGDPLKPEEVEVIRRWIADGAPADSKAKRMAKTEEENSNAPVFVAASFDGPPPMPEVTLPAPHTLPGRGVVARAVDTNPRSPLMAVGADRQVLIYQTDTNELLGALPFPEGDIYTLTFSVNGELLLAAGGQEGDMGISVLWNIRTGERTGTFGQYYDTVLAADISPDHRMIALGGPNRKVRVYSAETGEELYSLEKHNDWVQAVKFTPDGEVLATADRGGGMYFWQAANGREVEQLRGHEGGINALAYTLDSTVMASVGNDGTVQLWDTWKYNRIRSFKAHDGAALYVDINPEGLIITAGADRQTKVWAQDGKEQKAFQGSSDWVYAACFGLNNRVVGGTWAGNVILWDMASGNEIAQVSTNPAPPSAAQASAKPVEAKPGEA
jgi:WD40 repeat protein